MLMWLELRSYSYGPVKVVFGVCVFEPLVLLSHFFVFFYFSQMLILPPFQGEGHGAQLLETVHRFYCNLPKVQDITGILG